jgi:CRP-like cAMP-binding protein/ActR/RegA family two-component response regulator
MNKTILLIEDNAEMSENIASILELEHYRVLTAPNGKIGVTMAKQHQPDLILCDIMMPELDGYGVLHVLGNDANMSSIPFIFLTAKADKSEIRAGMNLGADDYLTKPFEGSDLLKVIEVRLTKNNRLKHVFRNNMNDVSVFFDEARKGNDLEKLLEKRHVRHTRKKDFIYLEGQTANDLYMVTKGEIKTFRMNSDGKELITGFHQEGSFIGYIPLLEDKPYTENAVAMEDSEITIIPRQDFLSLIYASNDMAMRFIHFLTNHLEDAENRLLQIAYQSVRQRVATALLRLHDLAKPNQNEMITIGRRDIANLIGTATESLNRTLSDFKDEHLIHINEKGIALANRSKLEHLAR